MTHPTLPSAPFVLEHRQYNFQPNGDFTPGAALLLTPEFRYSGLPKALTPQDFQTLLLILSCLTSNGSFTATPELLAPSLGISSGEMKARLDQLTTLSWRNLPLLETYMTQTGLAMYTPSKSLFREQDSIVLQAFGGETPAFKAAEPPAPREAIITHSREKYGRPRAEVEAEIDRFYNREAEAVTTPEDEDRLRLKQRLQIRGVTADQAASLLNAYPMERIEQQLNWLPYRHARNPAGYLVAAIEGDYEPPLAVRLSLAPTVNEPDRSGQDWEAGSDAEEATSSSSEGEVSLSKLQDGMIPLPDEIPLSTPSAEPEDRSGELD